jgi:RimJ/RimL family protein N-acetyltransferase
LKNKYKALNSQYFSEGKYSIIPIRYEDRFSILKWRNEQLYHLRQNNPLTESDQENYFNTVINKLFEKDQPSQILFSYLQDEECIGYGGLVHINWIDKNAEISFIMDTKLEKEHFSMHWKMFLKLIEQVAFKELKLYKIFTFAFDIRPHVFAPIEDSGFVKEATLKSHSFFSGVYKDVIIHSKFNTFNAMLETEA